MMWNFGKQSIRLIPPIPMFLEDTLSESADSLGSNGSEDPISTLLASMGSKWIQNFSILSIVCFRRHFIRLDCWQSFIDKHWSCSYTPTNEQRWFVGPRYNNWFVERLVSVPSQWQRRERHASIGRQMPIVQRELQRSSGSCLFPQFLQTMPGKTVGQQRANCVPPMCGWNSNFT